MWTCIQSCAQVPIWKQVCQHGDRDDHGAGIGLWATSVTVFTLYFPNASTRRTESALEISLKKQSIPYLIKGSGGRLWCLEKGGGEVVPSFGEGGAPPTWAGALPGRPEMEVVECCGQNLAVEVACVSLTTPSHALRTFICKMGPMRLSSGIYLGLS